MHKCDRKKSALKKRPRPGIDNKTPQRFLEVLNFGRKFIYPMYIFRVKV